MVAPSKSADFFSHCSHETPFPFLPFCLFLCFQWGQVGRIRLSELVPLMVLPFLAPPKPWSFAHFRSVRGHLFVIFSDSFRNSDRGFVFNVSNIGGNASCSDRRTIPFYRFSKSHLSLFFAFSLRRCFSSLSIELFWHVLCSGPIYHFTSENFHWNPSYGPSSGTTVIFHIVNEVPAT